MRPADRPMGRGFREDIQGLRALAVLLVVLYHAGLPARGGYLGVDVFFVISGFVIADLLLRELEATGRIGFLHFYGRRAKRLLPALALMLCVVESADLVLAPVGIEHQAAMTGIASALFGSNIYLYKQASGYFTVNSSFNPLLHTWSLGVEEQFYVLFPIVLVFLWRLMRRNRERLLARRLWLSGVVLALLLGSLLFEIDIVWRGGLPGHPFAGPGTFAFYNLPTRAWEFCAGILVAVAAPWVRRATPRLAASASWIGLALVGFAVFAYRPYVAPGLLAVVGAALIVAAGEAHAGFAQRLLATRPATWIGDRSYSWYLWHLPVIVFATALWKGSLVVPAMAALISLIPAAAAYKYIENPIRRSSGIRRWKTLGLAVACIAAAAGASYGGAAVFQNIRWLHPQELARSEVQHLDVVVGCTNNGPPSAVPASCHFGRRRSEATLVLIGDSNAGQFSEPVRTAAERLGMRLTIATRTGCLFADLLVISSVSGLADTVACHQFVRDSMADLHRMKPTVVVLASRSALYVQWDAMKLAAVDGSDVAGSPRKKATILRRGLRRLISRLSGWGIRVLVVHPIPEFPRWDPRTCAVLRLATDTCNGSEPFEQAARRRRLAFSAEQDALVGVKHVAELDFARALCPNDRCNTVGAHGIWLYQDGGHLSVAGAKSLSGSFESAIRKLRDSS